MHLFFNDSAWSSYLRNQGAEFFSNLSICHLLYLVSPLELYPELDLSWAKKYEVISWPHDLVFSQWLPKSFHRNKLMIKTAEFESTCYSKSWLSYTKYVLKYVPKNSILHFYILDLFIAFNDFHQLQFFAHIFMNYFSNVIRASNTIHLLITSLFSNLLCRLYL